MTNENDGNTPSANSQSDPLRQTPGTPPTPPQGEIRKNPNAQPNNPQETARELAREFRWVEGAQLAVNGVLAIVGIVALCIYNGQLTVMSGQLTEMQQARKQSKIDNANAIIAQQQIAQDSLNKSQDNFDKSALNSERTLRDEQRAWVGAI